MSVATQPITQIPSPLTVVLLTAGSFPTCAVVSVRALTRSLAPEAAPLDLVEGEPTWEDAEWQ